MTHYIRLPRWAFWLLLIVALLGTYNTGLLYVEMGHVQALYANYHR